LALPYKFFSIDEEVMRRITSSSIKKLMVFVPLRGRGQLFDARELASQFCRFVDQNREMLGADPGGLALVDERNQRDGIIIPAAVNTLGFCFHLISLNCTGLCFDAKPRKNTRKYAT
jgi:hypothetical protein